MANPTFFQGITTADEEQAIEAAAQMFNVPAVLVAGEYVTEGGANAAKPFGLLAGPAGYAGTGYVGKDDSLAEYAKVDAAYWSSDRTDMQKQGLPLTLPSWIQFHEAQFTPVGASNDPSGLNANKVPNMLNYVVANTGGIAGTLRAFGQVGGAISGAANAGANTAAKAISQGLGIPSPEQLDAWGYTIALAAVLLLLLLGGFLLLAAPTIVQGAQTAALAG